MFMVLTHVYTSQNTDTIFAYLSAILHLTNIQFELDHETDGVFIADEYPLLVGEYRGQGTRPTAPTVYQLSVYPNLLAHFQERRG